MTSRYSFLCFLLISTCTITVYASGNTSSTSHNKIKNTSCTLFPADSVWNKPVDKLPVHPLSSTYINNINTYHFGALPIKADFGASWYGQKLGISFDIIPANQPAVPISFDWPDESDLGDSSSCDTRDNLGTGCYPIPAKPTIEDGEDSHMILLQDGKCKLYEVFDTRRESGKWYGASGAIWDLTKNEMRPEGVTSADAAGLPILPGLIRYDEVYKDKEIRHVIRVTLEQIQSAYLRPPASHSDGQAGHDRELPPMGLQLRLKANYDISSFDPHIKVILKAMKKYGLIIADTGGQMYISGQHDERWNNHLLKQLMRVKITDFEAVDTGAELINYH